MVLKTGYILPAKNYIARMKALETALTNQHLRTLSALDSPNQVPKVSVPSVPVSSVFQSTPIVSRNVQLQEMNAQTPRSVSATPITPSIMPLIASKIAEHKGDTDLVKEIKQRLLASNFGLKNTKELKEMGLEDVNIQKKGTKPYIPIESSTDIAKRITEEDIMAQNDKDAVVIGADKQRAYDLSNKLARALSFDEFNTILHSTNTRLYTQSKTDIPLAELQYKNLHTDMRKNPYFAIPVGTPDSYAMAGLTTRLLKNPLSITQSWDFLKDNRELFHRVIIQNINDKFAPKEINGGSLVKAHYMKNAANFGNLFLNERQLKLGNLSISAPFSKTYLLHKKGISPLLKKMVMDIANTLEFDTKDYENLDGDEKRIIEKIIRGQKQMKETNIKKLIDDDDYKMKKRLQILVGEINAGNSSGGIIDEMKKLLKALFDNRAIGYQKYQSSLKAISGL